MSEHDRETSAAAGMDIAEIMQVLPHRHPMLLVDRVLSVEPGRSLVAVKCVTVNEPFFPGHFPAQPIVPGVLLVEAMAQAAGLLAYRSEPFDPAGKTLMLLGVDGARFRRPVVPGDRVQLTLEVKQRRGTIWKVQGVASVDGQRAAEAEILVGLVDRKL